MWACCPYLFCSTTYLRMRAASLGMIHIKICIMTLRSILWKCYRVKYIICQQLRFEELFKISKYVVFCYHGPSNIRFWWVSFQVQKFSWLLVFQKLFIKGRRALPGLMDFCWLNRHLEFDHSALWSSVNCVNKFLIHVVKSFNVITFFYSDLIVRFCGVMYVVFLTF